MRVCVITLCEAVNYGAFLQAYSMKRFLEKKGHDVVFLKSYSFPMLKTMIWSLYTYDRKKMEFKGVFRKGYLEAQKLLNKTFKKGPYDLAIIGSDEVWQLRNRTASPKPCFFGIGIKATKKIVYAACSNNTRTEDIERFEFVKRGLSGLDAVSVRDKETQEAYAKYVGNVPIVLDPTFLVDVSEFIPQIDYPTEPYIAVYTYHFDERKIKIVKEFSQRVGMKIVSLGQKFAWCDEGIPCTPFSFLGYLQHASYVFTDTFHGTVLSMQLHKELFVFAQKKKVLRALEEFHMEQRNLDASSDAFEISKQVVDYAAFDKLVNEKKERSLEYIDTFLS